MPPAPDPMQMQQMQMQMQGQQGWQPQQWSQGTRTQGDAAPIAGGPIAAPLAGSPMAGTIAGGAPSADASTDARLAHLQHDIESLALFARTLLTMLEEKNLVTREQFDETKKRLDMLDGKLDDR
jgi:hypothetical protein